MGKTIKELGKSTIRILVIRLIVIVFFVGLILFYYRMVYTREREIIIMDGEATAVQSANDFNEYLTTSLDAIKLTANALDGMIAEGKSDQEIHDYLVGQSNAVISTIFENTTGIYAYVNDKYVDGADWVPPDDYIPTERPWYINAMEKNGEIALIEPYLDVQTGNMMMTLAKTLSDGKSVVALDMSLERIQAITEESVESERSDIQFIIDDRGTVIAHSDKAEVNKNYATNNGSLGSAIYEGLRASKENYFEINHGGLHYIVYSTKIVNDWTCLSIKDTTTIFAPITVILILTIIVVIIISVIIAIMSLSSARRSVIAERLSKQLSATADIYISMHEINFLNDTFNEVRNNSPEVKEMMGETRNNCQEMIRAIMTKFSDPSSREAVLDFVDFSKLNNPDRLQDRDTMTLEWQSVEKRWRKSRYIVSDRAPDGTVTRAMYLIEDIDEEKRNSDMMQDTAKLLTSQLSTLANIYTSVHDVDILNNSFKTIKINDTVVQNAIDNDVLNAQEVIRSTMIKLTDESCRKEVLEFVDFSKIKENAAGTNTATVEFINSRGAWCRGRFIISEYTEDGELSHVIWAVENIDTEKRERDKLTETAQELNYLISSIVDIYLTAHDIDIVNDTFTEMKSSSHLTDDLSEKHKNARETFKGIMEAHTDESTRERVLKFIDLDDIDMRLRSNKTIAIEYLNREKQWRRGRFIASRRNNNGIPTHVLWLIEDIDAEKQQRDKLIDMSERAIAANEARSSFLSNMTQEIRTPLDAVLETNEIIRRDSKDAHITECAEKILRDGSELRGMINDILDYSAIEAGNLEIVPVEYDLSGLIDELKDVAKIKATEKGLHLVTNVTGEVPGLLYGDRARVRQIISNLLSNAIKHTDKGTVTLNVGVEKNTDEPGFVTLDINVMDTGMGMKSEQLEQLSSDVDSSLGGIGINTGITRELLIMMDSQLEIESVYMLGSKFSFRLKQKLADTESKMENDT